MILNPLTIKALLGAVSMSILFTNGLVNVAKMLIELKLDPVTQKKAHDAVTQFAALLIGIGVTVAIVWLYFPPATAQLIGGAVALGYAVGLAAMGNYDFLTKLLSLLGGSSPPPLTPQPAEPAAVSVVPPEPPAS